MSETLTPGTPDKELSSIYDIMKPDLLDLRFVIDAENPHQGMGIFSYPFPTPLPEIRVAAWANSINVKYISEDEEVTELNFSGINDEFIRNWCAKIALDFTLSMLKKATQKHK